MMLIIWFVVGGHDERQHLRQFDVTDDLELGEAEHARRLDLTRRDGLEPGAEDLGEIGGRIERHAEDAGLIGGRQEAEGRSAVIEDEELQQQRCAAPKLDVGADQPAQRRPGQAREQRDAEAEQKTEKQRHGADLDRDEKASSNGRRIFGDGGEIDHAGFGVSRRSRKRPNEDTAVDIRK